MTPQAKCVGTVVVFIAAAVIALINREMFLKKNIWGICWIIRKRESGAKGIEMEQRTGGTVYRLW